MSRRGENIRKRKDGRWEGRYLQEIEGKKKYRSVYAKSYNEVKTKLFEAKKTESEKTHTHAGDTSAVTIHELSILWFEEIKKIRKYSTYRKYKDIYEKHIKDPLGGQPTRELTSDLTAKFIPWHIYFNEEKENPVIANTSYSVLKCIETQNKQIQTVPVYDLLMDSKISEEKVQLWKDMQQIAQTFSGTSISDIGPKEEYEI